MRGFPEDLTRVVQTSLAGGSVEVPSIVKFGGMKDSQNQGFYVSVGMDAFT